MEANGLLRSGKTAHPTLVKFLNEQHFHSRLGIQVDPRPLPDRPAPEVEEYRLFMQAQIAWENQQNRASR